MPIRRPARAAVIAVASLIAGTSQPSVSRAEPGGCLKYGAVGAVGGHLAHHGVLGAAGGCAVGMYKRHKYRKETRAKADAYDHEHQGAPPDGRMDAPSEAPHR